MNYLYFKAYQELILLLFAIFAVANNALAVQEPAYQFFIKTTSTSLTIETETSNVLVKPVLQIQIQSSDSKELLWKGTQEGTVKGKLITFNINNLHPKLWSIHHPQLYSLIFSLSDKAKDLQHVEYRIGFRDFETKKGQLYLNGFPVFLRGIAINPPGRGIPTGVETSRTFAQDYVRYMKSINVNIIRIPDDQTWYDVCDEEGMMVFGGNYSGTVNGEKTPKQYNEAVDWYRFKKFGPIMHHPSLMIYALTNEVPFSGKAAKQWVQFLDYAFDKLKVWDPTRLYIGNAGYGLGKSGDICDLHRYWGWYYSSPFTFLNVRDYDQITFPEKVQPLTFTECVGNYTGPDGRYNLSPEHKNPVSQLNWTGHAPQNQQAALADQHQSFVFKQATELLRRLRRINLESSGVFPFTILFKNWHTVRSFSDMVPKAVTDQVKLSYQPVLISIENWQTQVYAGATISPIIHVINDSEDFSALKNNKLVVRILDKAFTVRVADTINIPDLPYYQIHSERVHIKLPDNLFMGDYKLEGVLYSDNKEVSRNNDPIYIEVTVHLNNPHITNIQLYDPKGFTEKAFQTNRIRYKKLIQLSGFDRNGCLVIGENAAGKELSVSAPAIRYFIRKGGRLIILKQDSAFQKYLDGVLPVEIAFPHVDIDDPTYPPQARPSYNSFNINPERTGHPAFAGISRERLRVWSDYTGWDETKKGFPAIYPVTCGFIVKNKENIEQTAVLADYSVGLEGIALAEFFEGKGSLLLSGFDLCNRSGVDPVADRLLVNCVNYMAENKEHNAHVLIDAPISWGEFETEKGILTGINSGFMLNSKPALYGSYENLPIIFGKNGDMFAEKKDGWNNAPGKEYVPYGRRLVGPYIHRDFGGVPSPENPASTQGEGFFWCRVPEGTRTMATLVWNPSDVDASIKVKINGNESSGEQVKAGSYKTIHTLLKTTFTDLKISMQGDRRLIILQTTFY